MLCCIYFELYCKMCLLFQEDAEHIMLKRVQTIMIFQSLLLTVSTLSVDCSPDHSFKAETSDFVDKIVHVESI